MTSRQAILDRLRSRLVDQVALPELDGPWIKYDDPIAQFMATVEFVGGRCTLCDSISEVELHIERVKTDFKSRTIVSLVDALPFGTLDIQKVDDPHSLASVDLVIAAPDMGIAENGAVWLDDRLIRHRVIFFITQHLILLLRRDAIVQNMHEAYERIRFTEPRFGLFLSGPSKTADIEQSLVLGAHGSRSLEIFLI